jgi:hypothetical protein
MQKTRSNSISSTGASIGPACPAHPVAAVMPVATSTVTGIDPVLEEQASLPRSALRSSRRSGRSRSTHPANLADIR